MSWLKTLIKRALARFGYTVQRLPSPASDPQLGLTVDFKFVLAHYLASRDDPRPFFFLQVGAFDGVMDDPLHRYVRGGNWHGILVEPQAFHFKRLTENYAGHEGLTFVNAAISEHPGRRNLYVIQDQAGVTIESLGGVASFREEALRVPLEGLGIPGSRVGAIEVACTTFADVLVDVSYLDLLQIDAEGYDLKLLKLFDFDRLKPPIVRFEHRKLSADESDEAVELLARHGYRMAREKDDVTAYLPA